MLLLAETIISLTIEGELTRGRQGQPVSVAPDGVHALTDELAIALVHSAYAMTGLHASAGGGLCVYERIGCDRYDNIGIEAHYRFAIAGVHYDDGDAGIRLGARLERTFDRFTLRATPSLIVPHRAWLPLAAGVRVSRLTAGIETGITAPLDEPSAWELAVGFTLEVRAHRYLTIGVAWMWPRITGGREQPADRAPIHGLEHRVASLYFVTPLGNSSQ